MIRRTWVLVGATLVTLLLLAIPSANFRADNPSVGIFEMDGNAIDQTQSPPLLPDDWDTLFGDYPFGSAGGSGMDLVHVFVGDINTAWGVGPGFADDIFTTGGAKDIQDVSEWRWTTGNVPDKDDISDAFAALYEKYVDEGGPEPVRHLIFVFGLDRYASNGDAQLGFWLFQRPLYKVTPTTGPLAGENIFSSRESDPDGSYIAHHSLGDILVLGHFTQGGTTVSLEVYEWVGGADPLYQRATGISCTISGLGVDACVEVNSSTSGPQNSPWYYHPKSGTDNVFPDGSFFEGNADLTQLLPGVQCFSSFMAETRSSQSLTAQLKDFALVTRPTCSIEVTKSCPAYSKAGDTVAYSYTVHNTGIGTLYLQSATDATNGTDGTVDMLALAQSAGCASLAPMGQPGDSCTFTRDYVVDPADPDTLTNTVTFVYNENEAGTGISVSDSDSCSVEILHPSISVDKVCQDYARVGDSVEYTITITNTGDADLVFASATDTFNNPLTLPSDCDALAPGESCQLVYSRTVLQNDPDPLVNTVTVNYRLDSKYGDLPNVISDEANCSTDIIHPGVSVTKSCDAFARVGDSVNYTITVTNTGDVPLSKTSIGDTLLGDLSGEAGCGDTLAIGASCVIIASRTVLNTDPDPLVNTVTVHYGIPAEYNISADYTDTDSCTTDIIHPALSVTKSCDAYARIGDDVNYSITVTNTGDVPLDKASISDTLLGDLSGEAGCGATLAIGASCTINMSRTVLETDPDPLPNTVTATYNLPAEYNISAEYSDSDSCATDIIHPALHVTKTCSEYAMVGGSVDYTITVTNDGDVPLTKTSIADTLLGDLTSDAGCGATLEVGASCTITKSRTVLETDPDPLPNTVAVHYGLPALYNIVADYADTDSCSTDIIHPSVTVAKNCTSFALVGGNVHYTITVTNNGDVPLTKTSIADSLLGDLSANAACGDTLEVGAYCTIELDRTVLASDPDPLNNTVAVHYGLPSLYNLTADITSSDSCATDILHPAIRVAKSCNEFAVVGGSVDYTITVYNEGDVELAKSSISDSLFGDITGEAGCGETLPVGAHCTITLSRTVLESDPDPLTNTATATYGLPASYNLSETVQASDSCTTDIVHPALNVSKSCDTFAVIGGTVHYSIAVTNAGDVPLAKSTISDTLLGNLTGSAGCGDTLAVGATCTITATRTVLASDPDPLPNTVTATYGLPGTYNISNTYSASDSCSTDIIHPAMHITKVCSTYAIIGGSVNYVIAVYNDGDIPLSKVSIGDTLLGDLSAAGDCGPELGVGQYCTISASRTVLETDPDPLPNTATATFAIPASYNVAGQYSDSASCSTDILHPAFEIHKSCLTDPVPAGASALFRINVYNTGDVPIIAHLVDANLNIEETFTLGLNPSPPCAVDVNDPDNGCFMVEGGMIATGTEVSNTATVDFTLDPSYGIEGIVAGGSDDAVCAVTEGGATRTLGFWKTHWEYTCHVFEAHMGGTMNLGWKTLTSCDDVIGMLYANPAKNADGSKRNNLCKARVQASHQAVAALLNSALSNGKALPLTPAEIAAIIGGSNRNAIMDLANTLDEYNNSGDNEAIVDNDGTEIPHADPQGAKDMANIAAGDC